MIPVIINYSSSVFNYAAKEICDGLSLFGETSAVYKNNSVPMTGFNKCVFLDKDIILGLTLEAAGVRTFNSIGAIETCADKGRTFAALKDFCRMPETEIFPLTYFPDEDFFSEYADMLIKRLSIPLIAKLSFGSQGREVSLLNSKDEILAYLRENYQKPHLYQRFIEESKGVDMRVYIVGNKIVASYYRINDTDFRSNIALGAHAEKTAVNSETEELCFEAVRMLGLDFAGVDVLFENGKPFICEVNSNALFKGADEVCGVKIGYAIADYVSKTQKFHELSY